MDEESALRIVDRELEAALGGITPPPHFAAHVLRRAREPRLSYWPDILDSIGILAMFSAVVMLLILFGPGLDNPYWAVTLSAAIVIPAFWFGIGSLRELGE